MSSAITFTRPKILKALTTLRDRGVVDASPQEICRVLAAGVGHGSVAMARKMLNRMAAEQLLLRRNSHKTYRLRRPICAHCDGVGVQREETTT